MNKSPKNLLNPTYDEIHGACISLANAINKTFYPNYILGISRGGLLPAVIMSHCMYNTPIDIVDYSSIEGEGDNPNNHTNYLPVINDNSPLLIIDDIWDSGHTMREVCDVYRLAGHEVKSVVLYYKDLKKPSFTPNYYWCKIYEDTGWVKFPWEV